MSTLFSRGRFTDFGPSVYLDRTIPTTVTRVEGKRPAGLRAQVRLHCPKKPGVYGMLDRHDQLIYVGKAKDLRARLLSYFRRQSRAEKAGKIIALTGSLIWEVCPHEFTSLLRELELIRRWRPRFNVQGQPLRRRQTFLCLGRSPAPYAFTAPRPPRKVAAAFGPVPAGGRMREAIRWLNDAFLLRDCPEKQEMLFADQGDLFAADHPPAGCLRLEIGTCLGPCTSHCARDAYAEQVRQARRFLTGKDVSLLAALEQKMLAAASSGEYERAANLRDRWQALAWLARTLERLRCAQQEMSFVYPIRGHDDSAWWYLIHGARTVAVVPVPRDADERRSAALLLRDTYRRQRADLLEAYEHTDGVALVMLWFRKFAPERARTLTLEAALALCEG